MVAARGRKRAPTVEQLELLDKILDSFAALPPKPKSEKLGSGIAEHMRKKLPVIEDALKKGYTVKQLAEICRNDGFEISVGTFKNYLKRLRDEAKLANSSAKVASGKKRGPKPKSEVVTTQTESGEQGAIRVVEGENISKATSAVDLQPKAEAEKATTEKKKRNMDKPAKESEAFPEAIPAEDL